MVSVRDALRTAPPKRPRAPQWGEAAKGRFGGRFVTDDQLLRYSRHILLNEVGEDVQERWLASHALIIGAGGLGSPAALYLGSAGVGHITIVDDDTVDLTNLQRQIAHDMSRIGQPKALSAAQSIAAINPGVMVASVVARADEALLDALVQDADVVLDCCDNFATRHLINEACVRHGKPLVSGAAIRFDGQVSVYDTRDEASPCHACATLGVFAPMVGIIGAMQAGEALKLLGGMGAHAPSLAGRLLMLDGRTMEWSSVGVPRDKACAVCAGARMARALA
jgi:molybdopterin/thiamine biosynthesis adenylyltransferase